MTIYSGERDAFTADEVRLLERLAADLAFGIGVLRQRAALREAEERLKANLRFFEGMDRVNQAIQQTADIDEMTGRVLEITLDLLNCDRATLLYPCDPEASSWRLQAERVRLEFAGRSLGALDIDIPTTAEAREIQRAVLAAPGPIAIAPGGELPNSDFARIHLGILSRLAMAIRPKMARAYAFGLHQCSHARVWSEDDRRLFCAIGRRFEDALTTLHANLDLSERENQIQTVFSTIPDIIWVKDLDGRYVRCNPSFERRLGRPTAEILGRTDFDFASPDFASRFRLTDLQAIESGEVQSEELETDGTDGQRQFEVLKAPLRDDAGKTIGVVGVARDITDRRKAEEQLRIAAAAFEAQEGIVILGVDHRVLRVNRAFAEMTGHAPEDVVGKTPQEIAGDPSAADRLAAIAELVERDGVWRGEILAKKGNGERFPTWTTAATVRGKRGEVTHFVVTMTDITERKRAEQEIVSLAYYDRLTGLPNRRLLHDRLQQAIAGSARSGRNGALLYIDLDNFKLLNETSGHEVGDRLLVEVARRLADCLGEIGGAARVGGDEFVALLEDLSEDPRDAAATAQRIGETIVAALNAPYDLPGGRRHSSPSIGVAMFSGGGASAWEELLKQADIAMYQAKAAGRNALRFFDLDMQAAVGRRSEAESRCARRSTNAASCCTISLRSTATASGSAPRRWCAGCIPSAGWLRRANSSRSPRRLASSCRSGDG